MQSSGLACMIAKRVNHLQVLRGISGGESETQPASQQRGCGCPKYRPIPPCRLPRATDFDAFGADPLIRPEAPSKMWVPWLMNDENSSGLSAFSATCRYSPQHVKPLVIEAMHPHSIKRSRRNATTGMTIFNDSTYLMR